MMREGDQGGLRHAACRLLAGPAGIVALLATSALAGAGWGWASIWLGGF